MALGGGILVKLHGRRQVLLQTLGALGHQPGQMILRLDIALQRRLAEPSGGFGFIELGALPPVSKARPTAYCASTSPTLASFNCLSKGNSCSDWAMAGRRQQQQGGQNGKTWRVAWRCSLEPDEFHRSCRRPRRSPSTFIMIAVLQPHLGACRYCRRRDCRSCPLQLSSPIGLHVGQDGQADHRPAAQRGSGFSLSSFGLPFLSSGFFRPTTVPHRLPPQGATPHRHLAVVHQPDAGWASPRPARSRQPASHQPRAMAANSFFIPQLRFHRPCPLPSGAIAGQARTALSCQPSCTGDYDGQPRHTQDRSDS